MICNVPSDQRLVILPTDHSKTNKLMKEAGKLITIFNNLNLYE